MQDRYAGDVGDFGQLALLRALSVGRRLGVCWYLTNGDGEIGNDGRHLGYLDRRDRFRHLDQQLFDSLAAYRDDVQQKRCERSVASLERLDLLPVTTRFHRVVCPRGATARASWAHEMAASMSTANLIFLDPDNGLEGCRLTPKSVVLYELTALRALGRALLLYHHQTRFRGGAAAEQAYVTERLLATGFASIQAIRFKPYSSRFYFLLDGDEEIRRRMVALAGRWGKEIVIYPPSP